MSMVKPIQASRYPASLATLHAKLFENNYLLSGAYKDDMNYRRSMANQWKSLWSSMNIDDPVIKNIGTVPLEWKHWDTFKQTVSVNVSCESRRMPPAA